jgi:hypothetical protein
MTFENHMEEKQKALPVNWWLHSMAQIGKDGL